MAAKTNKTTRQTKLTKDFVEAAATIGMAPTNALRIAREKNPPKANKTVVDNPNPGDPKNGVPGNLDHIQAYNKMKVLRNHIELRKELALQFTNVTPEMVLGATAMRAFASIDGAYDENGRFDIKLARESGAIHLIKKMKMTQHGFEVDFYSNESAQQQLASYMGMEFAPKDQNDDLASLKGGIEAVAREIAKHRKTEITHEIRVEAWTRVAKWVSDSKARYSPAALEAARKLYGVDRVDRVDDTAGDRDDGLHGSGGGGGVFAQPAQDEE